MPKRSIRRAAVAVGAVGATTALAVTAAAGTAAQAASHTPAPHAAPVRMAQPHISTLQVVPDVFASGPPTTADCTAQTGLYCYGPKQIETAYDMGPLYKKGDTGKGETIVIVDSFGSPTVKSDLATFDKGFGLPAPPKFTIIHPDGAPPKYDPNNGTMVSWAEETSLDVQYSHAMAPGANILLVETPVAETIGVHGFPQIVKAENYVINHHLGQVISQSFATAEVSFPSKKSLLDLRSAYVNADKHHVSVLAGAGDWGASSPSDASESTYYTGRTANWPASDPLVTALGGTQLHLNATGQRLRPDNVWNDNSLLGAPVAAGGTVSRVFARPTYQSGVASVTGNHRGVPDLSMSAAVDGGVLVYLGFAPVPAGYYIIGGTSEATPLFAGFVAVADQVAGHPLGLLNPLLYKLAAEKAAGIVDVTIGENTVTFVQGGRDHTVPGYDATPGYDLASGLGTIDGAQLAAELAKASRPTS